jgi:hypothetical protein
VFERTRHFSLSWARLIQSIPPHSISLRSTLTVPAHPRLGFHSGLFLSIFPTNTLSTFHATCLTHLTLVDLIILIIINEGYKLWSYSLCSFIHPPVTSPLLSTLFPNTLSPCTSHMSETKFHTRIAWHTESVLNKQRLTKLNSVAWVGEWTIATERPLLVGEVSINFCG